MTTQQNRAATPWSLAALMLAGCSAGSLACALNPWLPYTGEEALSGFALLATLAAAAGAGAALPPVRGGLLRGWGAALAGNRALALSPPRVLLAAVALVSALLFVRNGVACWPASIDDAFITFCYSRNLALGNGPVYTVGLPHAEGCSTPLWMLLMALPAALHLDVFLGAKVLGTLCIATALLVTGRTIYQHSGNLSCAVLLPSLLAAMPTAALHGVTGMETGFFMLMVAAVAAARESRWLPLLCLLLALTRPEAALLGVCLLGERLARSENRLQTLRDTALQFLLPGLVYFLWRWHFYGLPLPLPFYIKGADAGTLPGHHEVLMFAILFWPVFALALGSLRRFPGLVVGCLGCICYFATAHLMMGYDWRYEFPYLFGLLVPAGVTLARIGLLRPAAVAASLIALWPALSDNMPMEPGFNVGTAREIVSACEGLRQAHMQLGKDLAKLPRGTFVCGDAGAIAYYSGWRAIDNNGLNNRYIALHSRDGVPYRYVASFHPDAIVLRFGPGTSFPGNNDGSLYRNLVQGRMALWRTYRYQPDYLLYVFVTPPLLSQIQAHHLSSR